MRTQLKSLARSQDQTTIASPCVSKCELTTDGQHCKGCGRSRVEIATWRRLSQDERLAIMHTLENRKQTLGLVPSLS